MLTLQTSPTAIMSSIQAKFMSLKMPPTVLVIEDDVDYTFLLKEWFKPLSYLCVYVLTGTEGLRT